MCNVEVTSSTGDVLSMACSRDCRSATCCFSDAFSSWSCACVGTAAGSAGGSTAAMPGGADRTGAGGALTAELGVTRAALPEPTLVEVVLDGVGEGTTGTTSCRVGGIKDVGAQDQRTRNFEPCWCRSPDLTVGLAVSTASESSTIVFVEGMGAVAAGLAPAGV